MAASGEEQSSNNNKSTSQDRDRDRDGDRDGDREREQSPAEEAPDPRITEPPSEQSSLSRAVQARKAEFIRSRRIRIKVGTWNVAAIPGTEKDVGAWFVTGRGVSSKFLQKSGGDDGEQQRHNDDTCGKPIDHDHADEDQDGPSEVGIYVLGLQEIVDVSSPSETLRPYVDPAPSNRWKDAVQQALPPGYQLVAESQLVGLLLLVYAAPNVAPTISSVSTITVGTGLMGYMGNKGAVVTRIVLSETTRLVFVNAHLAAGADKGSLERRNWDAAQIVGRTKFDPLDVDDDSVHNHSEVIGEEDFAFWFGDLNYRLDDIPGEDVRRLLMLHTQNSHDHVYASRKRLDGPPSPHLVAAGDEPPGSGGTGTQDGHVTWVDDVDPETDPASLQTTLLSLLPHDQLRSQQSKGKAFHEGWREGEIRFLPTYKYDVGSVAMFDSSEKQRGPSWCDRILYRSRQDRLNYERQVKAAEEARKRDEEMKARGIDKAADDDSVLFDYDPETDGANDGDSYDEYNDNSGTDAPIEEQEQSEDPIKLNHYHSHQGILSSDHKPIDADFTLTYQAVIPELKAKVHQEVVRELDKAENEARPDLTVVVDRHADSLSEESPNVTQDPNAVNFGKVPYRVAIARIVTVANTGSVNAQFYFSYKPMERTPDDQMQPDWLRVHVGWPSDGNVDGKETYTLSPGESAAVEVSVFVNNIDFVRLLNACKVKVEDILVLRVVGGRDHFIPVYGQWLPTCFGRSLDELTRLPEGGARKLGCTEGSRDGLKEEQNVRLSAPRELFRLTESISELVERAVAEWGMTKGDSGNEPPPWAVEPYGLGWPFSAESWTLKGPTERSTLLATVREALDIDSALTSIWPPEVSSLHRLEILAETLLLFLRTLEDGIITADTWREIEHQIHAREKAKQALQAPEDVQAWVLDILASSPVHSVSFTFLTFMLVHIADEVAPVSATAGQPYSPKKSSEAGRKSIDGTSMDSTSTAPSSPITAASIKAHVTAPFKRRPRALTSSGGSEGTAGVTPAALRREAVDNSLASIFAEVVVSSAVSPPQKDKDKRAWDERKKSIIFAFMRPSSTEGKT